MTEAEQLQARVAELERVLAESAALMAAVCVHCQLDVLGLCRLARCRRRRSVADSSQIFV